MRGLCDLRGETYEKGIQFEFLDFTKVMRCFKEFMQLRDMSLLFDEVKKAGGIWMSKSIENNEVYEKDSMQGYVASFNILILQSFIILITLLYCIAMYKYDIICLMAAKNTCVLCEFVI